MQTTREMTAPLPGRPMLHALAKSWWLLLLRGIAAIIFGILAFVWPGLTLVTLVLLYGAFALVDGVISLIAAFTGSAKPVPTWWLVVVGLLGIAAGIVTFAWPGITRSCWCYSSAPGHWCTALSRSSARSSCARRSTMNGC
jgi:uncharacterized membrane protein HdeD (DUF308 family)